MQLVTISAFIDNLIAQFGYERILSAIISIFLLLVFLTELWKFVKYKSLSDIMELTGAGFLITLLFALTADFLLSGLAGLLAIMLVGVYEVRESPIWVRLMGSFAISYIWFFLMTFLGWYFKDESFTGLGYNLLLWVMVGSAFIFFGRKFIIVTRFISPQMVYLVIYLVVLLVITNMNLDWQIAYPAIFLANVVIYLVSGHLMRILFGIKDLDDKRVHGLIEQVQQKIDTPIKRVGIVNAPILNAFAYGPWFDQRMAYITDNISEFTDEEILGITAHEMAHLQKKHTLWLLGVTAVEFIIKRILDAPVSYWDFVLDKNKPQWDFLTFWIFNIMLFAVLLTVVKGLEGQADRITAEAGYGQNLMESLYRLEGFYYGIAGEIGLNAQLLTGGKRTKDEEIRFMGKQARHLYNGLKPGRATCFFNLIASHPLTSIRFVALYEKIHPIKVGLLTWMLLIPGLRGRALKQLQNNRESISKMLTEKYLKDFGSIEDYLENSREKDWFSPLVGKSVLVKPRFKELSYCYGKVTEIVNNQDITSPIILKISTKTDGEVDFPINDYEFILADTNVDYFTKAGERRKLIEVNYEGAKFLNFVFESSKGKKTSKNIGLPLNMMNNTENILFLRDGAISVNNLKVNELNGDLENSVFTYTDSDGSEQQLNGKELIYSLPPLIHIPQKRNIKIESPFYEHMKELACPILIYDKEDIDIGRPGIIVDHDPSKEIIQFKSGMNTIEELPIAKIDAIILDYPFMMVEVKKQIGIASRLITRAFDRDIKIKYINA